VTLDTLLTTLGERLCALSVTVGESTRFALHPLDNPAPVAEVAAGGGYRKLQCVPLSGAESSPHTALASTAMTQPCEVQVGYSTGAGRGTARAIISAISADGRLLLAALRDPTHWSDLTDCLIATGQLQVAQITGEAGTVVGYQLMIPFSVEV
jgi:hypothetical protein